MKKILSKVRRTGSTESEPTFISPRLENIMLLAIILTIGLVIFNQIQILEISSSLGLSGAGGKSDLSGVDVSQVSSTAMAIATVFPELKNAKNEQDVMAILLASGTPEYGQAMGVSFDDPIGSLSKLAGAQRPLLASLTPEQKQRFIDLASKPVGISCEHCCGLQAVGIDNEGNSLCGCQHNPALLTVTMWLMQNTDYSNAEILREVMRWKTLFFPQKMIALGVEVAGQDPSQLKDLPGMVGGC